jgi:hypothetical protein
MADSMAWTSMLMLGVLVTMIDPKQHVSDSK